MIQLNFGKDFICKACYKSDQVNNLDRLKVCLIIILGKCFILIEAELIHVLISVLISCTNVLVSKKFVVVTCINN